MFRITIVAAYVIVILYIGYRSMKGTKTFGDFFLANRTVGPWLTAFTYGTAYFSAVLIHRLRRQGRLGLWHGRTMGSVGQHSRRDLPRVEASGQENNADHPRAERPHNAGVP